MTTCARMTVGAGRVLLSAYEWEIDNYSSYTDFEPNKYIRSPSFNIHNSSWHLKLYPNGLETSRDYISLYLYAKNNTTKTNVRFAFSLIDSKKKLIRYHISSRVFSYDTEITSWGVSSFVEKSLLKNQKNDTTTSLDKITVVCEVVIEETVSYKTYLTTPNKKQHFKELKNSINNSKFSDVKFIVQGKEIFAHKIILASNSTVFAAMFEHKMRENEENIVTIEDVSQKVFDELLQFVYTGDCTLSEDVVSELFVAADKYQLVDLKSMCEEELCKNICADNVIGFLQLADMHSSERLKKETIEFIALNGKEIIDKTEFGSIRNFSTELLKDVFRGIFENKN